jgi:hypothetical protein
MARKAATRRARALPHHSIRSTRPKSMSYRCHVSRQNCGTEQENPAVAGRYEG